MKKTIYTCDKCGDESKVKSEFWMDINLKSSIYLYDDGTDDQIYNFLLCRECKMKFFKAIKKFGLGDW